VPNFALQINRIFVLWGYVSYIIDYTPRNAASHHFIYPIEGCHVVE